MDYDTYLRYLERADATMDADLYSSYLGQAARDQATADRGME